MTMKKIKKSDYINNDVSEDSEEYFDFARFTNDFLKENGFNQQEYMNDYNKKHYKRVTVLIPYSEKEIIEYLKTQKPVSSYILNLIKEDMAKKADQK